MTRTHPIASPIRHGAQHFTRCALMSIGVMAMSLWHTATADDSTRLAAILASAESHGGRIMIPPGDYHLDGAQPLPLESGTAISAYGARFHFPETVGDRARLVMFSGRDIRDFSWSGGEFLGHVFDPHRASNTWEPNANTRPLLFTTTAGGTTQNLTFRDIVSDGIAGAVVTVLGAETPGSDRQIDTLARNITISDCTLERSGKFMWDYGYLWQMMVWPEDYSALERGLAEKYFRHDLIRGPIRMDSGDDRAWFDNATPLPLTPLRHGPDATRGHDAICFFSDTLPANIVRGRQYAVIESTPEYIRIADAPGGPAIRFDGHAGAGTRLIANLYQAYLALYAPAGSGPGKGAIDLVGCQNVIVQGCRLSALGDTMHIQKCQDVIFTGNHITGSRMGAFFLAEFCRNATIVGNTVNGTNGSRVVSVEKSCTDVTIVGNTFRNGGRGSWINQPRNLILADNIFINNTTKSERNPRSGRRSFLTGDYEQWSELYFTTYEPDGRYGQVTIRGNHFTSGSRAEHAIRFAPGGEMLVVTDNIFTGPVRDIAPVENCQDVSIRNNIGLLPP